MTGEARPALTDSRPPQQYGYQPPHSPQPPYNNNSNNYGQPTPPPQQYGYNQVRRIVVEHESLDNGAG
jgi:hypothetical protein